MNTRASVDPTAVSSAQLAPASVTFADLVALAKPRITTTVLATTLGGLFAAPVRVSYGVVACLALGTFLIVAGANALNMYIERDSDRLMRRTADRPLPAGRMSPKVALFFGTALSVAAIPVLILGCNATTAVLAAIANASYVFLYTPLKPRSWLAVWVGAVPGAIPPLMGWTAATGRIDLGGLALFAILFFWQVPHFHAIALFRQSEYERAGLEVLPSVTSRTTTKRHIVLGTAALIGVSVAPHAVGMVGSSYLFAALTLGGIFFAWSVYGLASRTAGDRWARGFFGVSIPYLVLVFTAILVTRS